MSVKEKQEKDFIKIYGKILNEEYNKFNMIDNNFEKSMKRK